MRPIVALLALPIALAACAATPPADTTPGPRARASNTGVVLRGTGPGGTELTMRSTPRDLDAYSTRTSAPADSVYRVLTRVYRELGIEATTADPEARIVGNEGFERTQRVGRIPVSTIVRCGTSVQGSTTESYRVTLAVVSSVSPVEDGSMIATSVDGGATRTGTMSPVPCTSTGELEKIIARAVQTHLLPQ